MNRDGYLKTIRREQNGPVPYFFCFCNALVEKFKRKYGDVDYHEAFRMPVREIFLRPTKLDPREVFRDYLEGREVKGIVTEWGIELEKSSVEHFSHMIGPLKDSEKIEDILELPLPDFLEDYRWEGVREQVARAKENGLITMPGIYGGNDTGTGEPTVAAFMDVFEASWYLRGLDSMLMDFYVNEEFAQALLDKITDFKVELAKKWAQAGVDILTTGDDVGTQTGLMMSRDMYCKWLKPRLAKVIFAAKEVNPDILVFYHSDGNVEEIIPDLIEAGVEILNPIQPECMDPERIIIRYGEKLSFWGTVGTQQTMPFGSVNEVKAACKKVLSLTKDRGGLVLAPTHLLEPEVPLENVEAFLEALAEHNKAWETGNMGEEK